MPAEASADEVWRAMVAVVFEHRESWKRAVIEQTGLPFSRVRLLRRLRAAPLTGRQLAHAATMDAPAVTVTVNDLERRGLVTRWTDPTNRRRKPIALTDAGRRVLALIDAVEDPAPAPLAALDGAELRLMSEVLAKLR